jgi:PAT family beta-lactamase induction signal transducer AmpG
VRRQGIRADGREASATGYHARVAFGESTRGRLALFAGLYFAQGVPWGFLTFTLPLQLSGRGMQPSELGSFQALAWLPWVGKPVIGLLLDKLPLGRFGRRRPYVVLAELGMVVSLLALMPVEPRAAPRLFGALIFVQSLLTAVQDVATDALAIDILPAGERGRANGVMFAAKNAGVAFGATGLAFVGSGLGWPAAYLAGAALMALPALMALTLREPPATIAAPALARELVRSFATRAGLLAAVFALVTNVGEPFLAPLQLPLFRQQIGLSDRTLSTLALIGQIAGVAGALAGGVIADRLGRRRALLAGTVAMALLTLGFAALRPWWASVPLLVVYGGIEGALSSMLLTIAIALFMDLTNPRVGAAHFQSFMALLIARSTWGTFVGGRASAHLTPPAMFACAGLLELLPLPLLLLIDPARVRRAFAAARPQENASPAAGAPS